MSAAELLIEKAKTLNEEEAQAMLDHLALPRQTRWTAQELMLLPLDQRNRILDEQIGRAADLYRQNPDLIVPDVDAPLDYE